jgi:hypothetical protein
MLPVLITVRRPASGTATAWAAPAHSGPLAAGALTGPGTLEITGDPLAMADLVQRAHLALPVLGEGTVEVEGSS